MVVHRKIVLLIFPQVTIPMAILKVIPYLSPGWSVHPLVGMVHSWWLLRVFERDMIRSVWIGFLRRLVLSTSARRVLAYSSIWSASNIHQKFQDDHQLVARYTQEVQWTEWKKLEFLKGKKTWIREGKQLEKYIKYWFKWTTSGCNIGPLVARVILGENLKTISNRVQKSWDLWTIDSQHYREYVHKKPPKSSKVFILDHP